MAETLYGGFAKALKKKSYRGACPIKERPEKGARLYDVPDKLKAVVAYYEQVHKLSLPRVRNRRQVDGAVSFIRSAEAEAVEYFLCNLLREHFGFSRFSRITPCRGWQCSVRWVER